MRPVQKVSISLLIAIIGFSAFSFFAFSGLFEAIEASFYSPRVLAHYRAEIENAHAELAGFRQSNLARLSAVAEQEEIRTLYQPNQTRGDIEARAGIFRRIADDRTGFVASVFLNRDGTQIHFSTREDDFTERAGTRSYLPLEQIEDGEKLGELALTVPDNADMVVDTGTSSFVFRVPVMDMNGIWRGTGLFIFSTRSFTNRLISAGITDPDRTLEFVSTNGIILNVPSEGRDEFRTGIAELWEDATDEAIIRLSGDRDLVVPVADRGDFRIGYFVPSDELELSGELQAIVLAGTFLTLFLVVFLLLNIRQDSTVVLSERIKRFQLGLLREYLERGEELDWGSRRDELLRRKPEMTRRLKQGIGRVRAEDREKIDDLVDKSWDEIIHVLGSRRDSGRTETDLQQIERMLERVIGNLESRGPGQYSGLVDTGRTPVPGETSRRDVHPGSKEAESVDGPEAAVGVESIQELESAGDVEAVEELEAEEPESADVEPVEELVTAEPEPVETSNVIDDGETIGELEELEDVEPVEELEAEELESADAEPVEELEAEELESADAEPIEELEAEDLESVDAEPVEELESAEEIDTIDDPEDLEEIESVEMLDADSEPLPDESDELRNADIRDEVEAIVDEQDLANRSPAPQGTSPGGEPASESSLDDDPLAQGEIVSLDAARAAAEERSIVSDRGGVFRIRDELYSRAADRPATPDDNAAINVGSERREEAILLLGDVDMKPLTRRNLSTRSDRRGRSDDERVGGGEEKAGPAPVFAPEGLDFDLYLSHFPDDEPGIMRALMLLTRKVHARVAMIAVRADNEYRSEHGIGLHEHEKERVHVSDRSHFAQSILNEGQLFRFEGPLTEVPDVRVTGEDTSLAECRCTIFVPIKFRGTRAYLVLGLGNAGMELRDVAATLAETIRSRSAHR